jgi:ubiquitin-protein ligase
MLSEMPHPMEIAVVFSPARPFHPNIGRTGLVCLGHPTPGVSMEQILHQIWAAITFNMNCVNVRTGEVMNRDAAEFVRQHRDRFPLTSAGLFEASPVT